MPLTVYPEEEKTVDTSTNVIRASLAVVAAIGAVVAGLLWAGYDRAAWFITAVAVVTMFWATLVRAITSWVPTARPWKRANVVRLAVREVNQVTTNATDWLLWVLRPLPLLVAVGQRADGTSRAWRRVRALSARNRDDMVTDPRREGDANQLASRKLIVDFRVSVVFVGLFLAGAMLVVPEWVTVIRW